MELSEKDLEFLKKSVPGNAAIYKLKDGRFETLYMSPGIPALNGMTFDEYAAASGGDASNIAVQADIPALMEVVRKSVDTGTPIDYYFRVKHKKLGVDWTHICARVCGEMDGCPVFLAIYTNASVETDIYQRILGRTSRVILVYDCGTKEILFMNKTARQYGCGESENPAGLKCFKLLHGRDEPCVECIMNRTRRGSAFETVRYNKERGAWERVTGSYIEWCGHDAFVQYIDNIDEEVRKRSELKNILQEEEKLVSVVQVLSGQGSVDERMNEVLRIIGEGYEADRAYIFAMNGNTTSNTYEWCRDGIEPEIDRLQNVDISYMNRWIPGFEKGEAVAVPDVEAIRLSKPDEFEIMTAQSIHSYIEAPIMQAGELTGFIGVDNPNPDKLAHSGKLMLSLAYSVSDAMAKAAKDMELEEGKIRYELAAEGADLGIWEYRVREHRMVNPNKRFLRYNIPESVENFPEVLMPLVREDNRERLRRLYRSIDAGEAAVSGEFWMKWAPEAPYTCERITYSVVNGADGKPLVAYGTSLNVTDQRLEQEKYKRSIQELLTANPLAIGSFRLDLTQNVCWDGRAADKYIVDTLTSPTADGFLKNLTDTIIDKDERENFSREYGRESLLAKFSAGKSSFSADFRRREANGKIRWVRSYFSMLKNPDTKNIECVAYAQDITSAKRNDEIFKRITDQEFDYVALLHLRDNRIEFIKMNSNLSQKFRDELDKPGTLFDFDWIRNYTADTWISDMDREMYLSGSSAGLVRRELDENGNYEMSIRGHAYGRPDEMICRKIQHYYLNDDRDTVLIIQTDVTVTYLLQEKELEYAKTEAERVSDILDSVSSGICVLRMPDCDHLLGGYVNLPMFRILGYDTGVRRSGIENDPLISAYLKDAFLAVCHEDRKRIKKVFRDNYGAEYFDTGNYRIIKKNGEPVWVDQEVILKEATPDCMVYYANYHVVEKEVMLQEKLTRRLKEEKKLRRQADAANKAKTDFLSRMSHDIRTPLNGIIGMAYLAGETEHSPKTSEYLKKIDMSSKFLLSLVNDILDMSKAESGKIELHPEPYSSGDFIAYLNAVVRPLCDEKNQIFEIDAKPVPGISVVMDQLRVNQVFFNLLSNAVKFTPEGGKITYRLREKLTESGKIALMGQVEDNGIGMTEEFQRVLFDQFTQESRNDVMENRGSGLGLAIAKKLMDQMGGTISVKSAPGKGTVFTLRAEFEYVPEKPNDGGSGQLPESGDHRSLSGRHVLLCEDHPLNQEIAKAMLEEKGILVDIAENGQTGVEKFKHSAVGYYNAVLMDIRMPVMDGYEAVRNIRALTRDDAKTTPVIAMTADAFADDVQKCLDAGMNGHVAKPIDPERLFSVLDSVFQREASCEGAAAKREGQ